MNFDWVEYLDLAKHLAGEVVTSVTTESKFRASISRAYFAADRTAKNFLRDRDGNRVGPPNEHDKIVNLFAGHPTDRTRRRIGQNLNRLREYRKQADYDDVWELAPLASSMLAALLYAQKVVDDVASL